MGDDDELRIRTHLREHLAETSHVAFVQGRVDFVQNAEGAGLVFENGNQEGERRKRLFTAGEKQDILQAFARRLSGNIDARFPGTVRL